MRLRTVTGNRYETRCADNCGSVVAPSDTVKVVIDLDLPAGKRTYLFAHSPDASYWTSRSSGVGRVLPQDPGPGLSTSAPSRGSCGPDAGKWKGNGSTPSPASSNGGNGHATGFTPASALPAPPPRAPEPPAQPCGPSPVPLALLGSVGAAEPTPSAAAGVPWATSHLTFNAGAYESAKSGFADYSRPGESAEQLRERVNRVVLEDLERSVRAMRELHERLGDVPMRTSSPGPRAGAPSGASASPSSPPRVAATLASPASEEASPGLSPSAVGAGPGAPKPPTLSPSGERPLKDLVREVRLDLSDADPLRLSRKMKVWTDWLGKRGYTSANDVRPGDEWALEHVLGDFETVNRGGRP